MITLLIYKQLTVREQYLQVIVNGKINEVFTPTAKGFTPTGRVQTMIDLKDGANEIILTNPVVTAADSSFIQYRRLGNAL